MKVNANPALKVTTVFLAILLCVHQAITTIKLAKLLAAYVQQVITARQVPQHLHNAQAERTTNLQPNHLCRAAKFAQLKIIVLLVLHPLSSVLAERTTI